jgi:hypothetical protein
VKKERADFAIFGMAFAIFQLNRMGANMGLDNSNLINTVEFSNWGTHEPSFPVSKYSKS